MVSNLKKFVQDQFEAFSNDNGMAEEQKLTEQLDMLERGISATYNPSVLEASRRLAAREGFCENFIRRDKQSMTFVMYEQGQKKRVHSGKTLPAKTQTAMLENSVEVLRARYKTELCEFWLFNAHIPMTLMDDEEHAFAKLYWNQKKKNFVLKNRFCTHCTQQSYYFCDEK